MELHLGRFLERGEVVHHRNEDRADNSLENLEIKTNSTHAVEHGRSRETQMLELKCPWCEKNFVRERRQTFLVKKTPLGCTCCSATCRGKLARWVQLGGDVSLKVSGHVVRRFTTKPQA